ncbi:MAG: PAS domain S-box protein [Kofleriaceae bacterium]|nr:PAS domain S-box protein [Kofleriaceae bacterium]
MQSTPHDEWLVGGGETGELIRNRDWSQSPLGPRDRWPDVLRVALNLVIASGVPMGIVWGPDECLLYNDAFRAIAIDDHPDAFGRPLRHGMRAGVSYESSPLRDADGREVGALITSHVPDAGLLEMFDSSFSFFGLLSVDGLLLKANRTALDFIGASWPEVANRPFWDTPWWSHSSEMRALCRAAVLRAAEGERVQIEVTHPTRTGSLHHIDFTITPIRDATGKVVQLVPEGRDITERRRADAFRQENESQFQALSDLPTEGIMIHINGIIVAANRAFGDFIGLPPEALIGKNGLEIIPLTDASKQLIMERSRMRYQGAYEVELRGSDGTSIYAETRGQNVTYRGSHARMISMRDITERKLAELALRTSEAQLRANLETTPNVAVQWYDEEGRVLYWNRASELLYGWTREDALGKTLDRLILTPEEAVEFRQALEQVQATNEPVGPYELHVRRRDGCSAWVLATTFALPLGENRTGFVCMDVDITERRQAEQAVRESDRNKSEFIAMLSHELRNPLAPICNSLFLLEQAAETDPAVRRAADVIGRQVGHLTRLIDDLLDVTRITRGKIELVQERLDLNELMLRVVDDHRPLCAATGLELATHTTPEPVWVNADPTRLAQAVDNLVGNAVKFTPRAGRILVAVSVDEASDAALLSVCDTGAGIAPEMMPRLFQPFTQADRTLDRSKGGLGLGLAVVKGLAELHGGSVTATSLGINAGATFTIRLPRAPVIAIAPPQLAPARAPVTGQRVLVIEDNVDAADSLRDAFELIGLTVAVAYDGPSGIECARLMHPDIVICDIGLPGMDGYDVARTLRADPAWCPATLVALSGYATKDDVARAMEAGFHTHLAKPASIEALKRALGAAAGAKAAS